MILRKNIQQSWLMRCASPSTPTSWRMMSWMDLTVVRTDMGYAALLIERGLASRGRPARSRALPPNALMSCNDAAHRVEGRDLQHVGVVEIEHALVAILLRAAHRARRGPAAPYLVNTSRFLTFSARSRRVSGFWSKATWQIRSKGSRSLPSSSAIGVERQALGLQFLDDRLLALGRLPALEEIVEAGEALLQRRLGEVAQGSR